MLNIFTFKKIEVKAQRDRTSYLLEWQELKRLMILTSVGREM